MMSVPAINPVLPSSGNQPPKVNSGPATNTVSPIGLTLQQKVSVIPTQLSTSPNKPSISVNHSAVPLSLVHENKISGAQAQTPIARTDKPKDLSSGKPTSNGVEVTKTPSTELLSQDVAPPSAEAKLEEKPAGQPVANHGENDKTASAAVETAVEEGQNDQDSSEDQNQNQTDSSKTTLDSSDSPKATATSTDGKPAKAASGTNKRKRDQPSDEDGNKAEEPVPEKKPQRIRSQVLPYQSPLPEFASLINKSLKEKDASHKSSDEKLIVFYKNEFLAVRNAENGFYLCQTLQNVYRTSHRIRIRWLSQDVENNTVYTPDFYDLTDIECILTTVALEKLEKNKYKLPQIELERTENILKRALDVETGVSEKPSVTEEHPDGLDLSLYKDESQLQKPKKRKTPSSAKSSKEDGTKGGDAAETEGPKKKKAKTHAKTPKKAKKATKTKAKLGKKGKSEASVTREKSWKNVDQLKVSPTNEKARVVAKVLRKVEVTPTTSKKSKSKSKATKSNSKKTEKKSKKTEKSSVQSRTSERKGVTGTSRSRSGKK